jgi:hypothetical protein
VTSSAQARSFFERPCEDASHLFIEENEVALGVEVKGAKVEVRRADDREHVVGDEGLGVEDRRPILEDPHPGLEEPSVVPVPA